MNPADDDATSRYDETGSFLNRAGGAYEDAFDPNKPGSSVLSDGEGRASKKPELDQSAPDTTTAQNERESSVASGLANQALNAVASTTPVGKVASFLNSVSGRGAKNNQKRRGVFQKALPILMIALGVGGFGAGVISAQMSLPVALAENLMRRFDNMSVENRLVGRSFLKKQLNPSTRSIKNNGNAKNYLREHSTIYAFATGKSQKYFKVSEYQQKKLENQNIKLVDFDPNDHSKGQYMQFTEFDEGGKVKKITNVVADESQKGNILRQEGQVTVTFDEAMTSDSHSSFNTAYYEGAKTFRSAVGDWYKSRTASILKKLGVSRNRFSDFDATQDAEGRKQQVHDVIEKSQGGEGVSATVDNENLQNDTKQDENGSEYEELKRKGNQSADLEENASNLNLEAGTTDEGKIRSALNGAIGQKVKRVGGIVDLPCVAIDMAGAVNAVVTAYETLVMIRLASTILEGIQKTQVADSTESPIHEIINALNDDSNQYSITVADIDGTATGNASTILSGSADGDNSIATKEYKSTKSAMESAGMAMVFGATVSNLAKNSSFASLNSNNWLRAIIKRVGGSRDSLRNCAIARIGESAISAGIGGAEIALLATCAFTAGLGCFASGALKVAEIGKKVIEATWQPIVQAIIVTALVPFVSNILKNRVADAFYGENLGNMLVTGSKAYMSKVHHSQGGVYQTKESYTAYLNLKDQYEQEQRVYARATTSPFDASSPYTFAGSLYTKFIGARALYADSGGGVGVMSALSDTFGSSLKAVLPGASASSNGIDVQKAWEYTQEHCPNQAEAGFIVDPASAVCSVIVATTPHIVNSDPGEIIYNVSQHDEENFYDSGEEERDLPRINENGEYAEYLRACTFSDVEPGEPDYNLKNELESPTGGAVGDIAVGVIPVVGDIVSIFNESRVIEKMPYITKEACRYNYDSNLFRNIPSTERLNDYASVFPHSRVAVAQGITDVDIVGEYAEEYYRQNPLDLSFEGILAHYSGLTKDMVATTLDYLDVMNFIAEYNPDGYGPLYYETPEANYRLDETVLPKTAPDTVVSQSFFAEHRWRNFAC